jgi:hypothetical protein
MGSPWTQALPMDTGPTLRGELAEIADRYQTNTQLISHITRTDSTRSKLTQDNLHHALTATRTALQRHATTARSSASAAP